MQFKIMMVVVDAALSGSGKNCGHVREVMIVVVAVVVLAVNICGLFGWL